MNACTIIAKNYAAFARVLAASFLEHHPDGRFWMLVIDDHEPMRRNVLMILEMEGFKGLGAENGRQGLELARREKPDLILCDVMMPELDGYAVVQALRERRIEAAPPPGIGVAGGASGINAVLDGDLDDFIAAALAQRVTGEAVEVEEQIARVEVRATFKASRVGTIAGSYVTEGTVRRGARARRAEHQRDHRDQRVALHPPAAERADHQPHRCGDRDEGPGRAELLVGERGGTDRAGPSCRRPSAARRAWPCHLRAPLRLKDSST